MRWSHRLPELAGVNADSGGALSSLGTIIRESGKPAVSGIGGDLSGIVEGTLVEIDGTTGASDGR